MATSSSVRRIATSNSLQLRCLGDTAVPRAVQSAARPFICSQCRHPSSLRPFSSAPYVSQEPNNEVSDSPRWKQTPRGMEMPFRIRSRDKRIQWECNNDPKRLADFYNSFLGEGGESLLTEDTRWLAVTHKSFDQGRRGFNDRLSYLGKRIVDLQTSLALVAQPRDPLSNQGPDVYGRYPFEHPLLEGLEHLSERQKSVALNKNRLAQVGKEHGLQGVLRWKPKKVDNLSGSGLELVMAQAIYAIVGAVSLEKGGQLANQVTREKILRPLGLVSLEQS